MASRGVPLIQQISGGHPGVFASANTPGYAVCVASQICERIGVHGHNRKSTNTSGWHCSNMWSVDASRVTTYLVTQWLLWVIVSVTYASSVMWPTEYSPRFMSGSCKMLTHLVFSSIQFTARPRTNISQNLETGPWRQNPADRMCHFSDMFLLRNSLNPKSPLNVIGQVGNANYRVFLTFCELYTHLGANCCGAYTPLTFL